jgi:hypothetical protein
MHVKTSWLQVDKLLIRGESAVPTQLPEFTFVPITRTGWWNVADLLRKLSGVNAVLPKHLASQVFADSVGVATTTIATFYQRGRLVLRMITVGGQCGHPRDAP